MVSGELSNIILWAILFDLLSENFIWIFLSHELALWNSSHANLSSFAGNPNICVSKWSLSFFGHSFFKGKWSLIRFDETLFPHSLGIYYTAVTQFLGFNNYGEEYKVMGLAPYGEPKFESKIRNLIISKD